MKRWEMNGGSGLSVSYESEFVCEDSKLPRRSAEQRIAIADDDEALLRFAGNTLSKAGYRVSAMRSGRALLKYLTEQTPDLILLDVSMPEQDGIAVFQRLREIRSASDTPVVFLTDSDDAETECRCFELGAEDIIRKPFAPELLTRRISRITELAELRRYLHISR